jgi:hypothetical protein
MTITSRSILLTALLLAAVPATGALAQSNPADRSGGSRIGVAMTGRTSSHQDPVVVGAPGAGIDPAAEDPNAPGATGRAIVRGTHSTIAGQTAATEAARTGDLGLL